MTLTKVERAKIEKTISRLNLTAYDQLDSLTANGLFQLLELRSSLLISAATWRQTGSDKAKNTALDLMEKLIEDPFLGHTPEALNVKSNIPVDTLLPIREMSMLELEYYYNSYKAKFRDMSDEMLSIVECHGGHIASMLRGSGIFDQAQLPQSFIDGHYPYVPAVIDLSRALGDREAAHKALDHYLNVYEQREKEIHSKLNIQSILKRRVPALYDAKILWEINSLPASYAAFTRHFFPKFSDKKKLIPKIKVVEKQLQSAIIDGSLRKMAALEMTN